MTRKLIAELVLGLRNNMGPGAQQAAEDLKKVEAAADRLGKSSKLDAASLKALSEQMDRAGKEARDFAAAMGAPMKWGSGFDKQLSRLKLTADELAHVKRSWMSLQGDIQASGDAAFRRNLIQRWRAEALGSITAVRAAKEQVDTEDLKALRDRAAEEQKQAKALAEQKEREAKDQERAAREAARREERAAKEQERRLKAEREAEAKSRAAALARKVREEAAERRRKAKQADEEAKAEEKAGLRTFLFRSRLARDEQQRKDRDARAEERRQRDLARAEARERERAEAEARKARAARDREETKRQTEKVRAQARADREAAQQRAKIAREEAAALRKIERERDREVRRLDTERRRIESEQRRHLRDLSRSFGRNLMYTATGITGVYGGAMVARRAIEQGATYQREGARDYLSGMSVQETARAQAMAIGLSDQYKSINPSTMRMLIRETANTSVGMKGAEAIAPELAKSLVVLQSQIGTEQALESLMKFTRALDVMGRNVDPKVVAELLDASTRAAGVMGAEFKPGDMLQFAKYAKSAGGSVSNEFLATMAPLLSGDMGPSRLGTALGTGMASVLSNKPGVGAGKYARAQQIQMGIRNESGIISPELFATDPHRWAWEILKPALQNKGIDTKDEAQVTKAVNQMFPQTVADLLQKLIQQEDQYRIIAEKFRRAPSTEEAANELPKRDPFVAFEGMIAQWDRFTNALTTPALQSAIPIMSGIAGGLSSLASIFEANPDLGGKLAMVAAGIGAIGATLLAYQGVLTAYGAMKGLANLGSGSGASGAAAAAAGAAGGAGGVVKGLLKGGAAGLLSYGLTEAGKYGIDYALGVTPEKAQQLDEQFSMSALASRIYGRLFSPSTPTSGFGVATTGESQVPNLREQLAESEARLAGIQARQHPSMAGAPNIERDRLEAEIADLRARIAQAEADAAAAGQRAGPMHDTSAGTETPTPTVQPTTSSPEPDAEQSASDLREQLVEREAQLVAHKARKHPAMVDAPDFEGDRLEAEIADLRARIAQAEAEMSAAGQRAGVAAMRAIAEGIRSAAGEATSAASAAAAGISSALRIDAVSLGVSTSSSAASAPSGEAVSAPSAPGRASGGPMYAGQAYRVNEHQGEYVYAKEASQVMKQGAVVTLSPIFHINGGGNAQEICDQMMARLEDMARSAFRDIMGDYGTDPA